MFEQLKNLNKMRELESALGKEVLEKEREGIKVVMNGRSEIISISLNAELAKDRQEAILKDIINDVSRDAKMMMAKRAMEITGFKL